MANHTIRALAFIFMIGGIILFIIGFAMLKGGQITSLEKEFTPHYILAILGSVQALLFFIYVITRRHRLFAVMFVFALILLVMVGCVAYQSGSLVNGGPTDIILIFVGALCFGLSQILLPWTGHQHHGHDAYISI